MNTFGSKIKAAREERGLSQAAFSQLVGANSQKTISTWETDRSMPDAETIVKICQVLNLSADYLLGLKEDIDPDYSVKEAALLDAYRNTDEIGQDVIEEVANSQLQRSKKTKSMELPGSLPSENESISGLFINRNSKEYVKVKSSIDRLKRAKKESYLSYNFIIYYLWINGYSGMISIYDLIQIFRGKKIPSLRLYNDIMEVLQKAIDNFNMI